MAGQDVNLRIEVDTGGSRNEIDNLSGDLRRLGKQGQTTKSQVENVGRGATNAGKQSRVAANNVRQLSYQIQDVAVQAGMGTDSLRILAQQGPQIASVFGPAGAAFGAIIAIGAGVAGALVPSLLSGKDAFESLAESVDDLGRLLEINGLAIKGFSEELIQLQDVSASAAIIAINAELFTLTKEMNAAEAQIRDFTQRQLDLALSVQRSNEDIAAQTGAYNAQARANQEAVDVAREFNDVIQNLDYTNIDATTTALLAMADATDDEEIQQQIYTLNENIVTVLRAKEAVDSLTTAQANLREGTRITNETISTQNEIIAAQGDGLEQLNISAQSYNDLQNQRSLVMTDTNALMKQEEEASFSQISTQDKVKDAILNTNAGKIISSSYSAAMSAYEALAGIPVIGPALGAVAAAKIIATGAKYASASVSGRALGGQVRGGESYIVGERGPEVLTMGSSRGFITPNDQLRSQTVNNAGNVANVTFNITANDTAGFDELLNKRRGQIIGIVNQALNNNGRRALV